MTDRMTPEHEQILKNWPGPTVYMNHIRTLLGEIHALRGEVAMAGSGDTKKELARLTEALATSDKRLAEVHANYLQADKDRAEYQAAFEEAHQLMMDMEGKWLRG